MKSAIVCIAACAMLAGCATQVISSAPLRSYTVGQPLRAPVGGVLLTSQNGSIQTVRRWVGILYSPDGWQTDTRPSLDFIRRELIYSGTAGHTVELGYREYRGGLAAPAFYQSAKYDLAESKTITFQNFQIEVYTADNNGMTGKLLSDGSGTVATPSVTGRSGNTLTKGKNTYQAEQLARTQSCAPQPDAKLMASGPGFETYSAACSNGDTMMIRCEFGNCRALK